jgi:hypothetical protein
MSRQQISQQRARIGACAYGLEHGREIPMSPVRDPFRVERLGIEPPGEKVRAENQKRIAERELEVDELTDTIAIDRLDRFEVVVLRPQSVTGRLRFEPLDERFGLRRQAILGHP